MKQLTKKQLKEFVDNAMVKVYEANAENIGKDIGFNEDTKDLGTIIGIYI